MVKVVGIEVFVVCVLRRSGMMEGENVKKVVKEEVEEKNNDGAFGILRLACDVKERK